MPLVLMSGSPSGPHRGVPARSKEALAACVGPCACRAVAAPGRDRTTGVERTSTYWYSARMGRADVREERKEKDMFGLKRITIARHERGLVFRNRSFKTVLEPGVFGRSSTPPGREEVQVYDITAPGSRTRGWMCC